MVSPLDTTHGVTSEVAERIGGEACKSDPSSLSQEQSKVPHHPLHLGEPFLPRTAGHSQAMQGAPLWLLLTLHGMQHLQVGSCKGGCYVLHAQVHSVS